MHNSQVSSKHVHGSALLHSGSGRYAVWTQSPQNINVWSKAVCYWRASVTCPCGWLQTTIFVWQY